MTDYIVSYWLQPAVFETDYGLMLDSYNISRELRKIRNIPEFNYTPKSKVFYTDEVIPIDKLLDIAEFIKNNPPKDEVDADVTT